jgi:hypothetical protein
MFLAIPPGAWEEADSDFPWASACYEPRVEEPKTEQPKKKPSHEYDNNIPRAGHILLTFPDELLINILELAVIPPPEIGFDGKPQWPHSTQYDGAWMGNVALTCRRFGHLMVPFIYRKKQALYNMRLIPPEPRLKLLLRSFRESPSLGLYCRELYLNVSDHKEENEPDDDYGLAEELPTFMPNIRHMFIHGGFNKVRAEQTLRFLRVCVQHMHQLRHLSWAQRGKDSVSVAEFLQIYQGQASALEELSVIGFSASVSRYEDLKVGRIDEPAQFLMSPLTSQNQ